MSATITLETETLRISKTIDRADMDDPDGVGRAVVALVNAFDAAEGSSHNVRDYLLKQLKGE
jgi:hypothetical protein